MSAQMATKAAASGLTMTHLKIAATGLTFDGQNLFHNGVVPAVDLRTALTDFLAFLSSVSPCILLAHNGHAFDSKILL